MFLFILGLIVLVVGFVLTTIPQRKPTGRLVAGIGVVISFAGILLGTFRVVDAGEVGVVKFLGEYSKDALVEGPHFFVNPFASVTTVNIRTQNFTMGQAGESGGETAADSEHDPIRVLTSDGLEVAIDLTILYKIDPNKAPTLLREIGPEYRNTFVRPITRTAIRDNAVYYDAVSLYSTKRDTFQVRILNAIEKAFASRGLILEELLIRQIELPQSVKASIEAKINAEQEAQKMEFVLQKEKQEAERKRVEAQGRADAQRILGQTLTDRQLQYEQIAAQKALAESPNSKIIILGGGARGANIMVQP